MSEPKYRTLATFKAAFDAGRHPEAEIEITENRVRAMIHHWKMVDGEREKDKPSELLWETTPLEAMKQGFALLGLKVR